MLLIAINCRWCDFPFFICRACWRGHAYCCDSCRTAGNLKNRSKAQRKYRQTEKGKKNHRESENRRRYRLTKKKQKNMDDIPSTVLPVWCTALIIWTQHHIFNLQIKPRCRFCCVPGQLVPKFPRRGYG